MSDFMVVLRGNDPEFKKVSQDEANTRMEEYYDWVDGLKEDNRYRGGAPFKETTKFLTGRREFVMISDGPYVQHGEALTGYFIIEASGLIEAVEIAKKCPALAHGRSVEVIEIAR